MAPQDAAPRILIRQLRRIMSGGGTGQERLDKIVRLIAGLMVAEVSSVYVVRQDGSLELFATQGLNPDAVHTTRMNRGEGLVGLISERARAVSLTDAQSHPAFSYRPETGEESYHSFLGVPVLRAGRVLGVLTVQNATQRHYTEDEEEALQTIAMVLAELLASGDVQGVETAAGDALSGRAHVFEGATLSDGLALGNVVLHAPRVVVTQLVSDDPLAERDRLDEALGEVRAAVERMFQRRDLSGAGEHRDVFDAYRMFLDDRGWRQRLREAVGTGLTADAAVERVRNDMRARMVRRPGDFWHERFRDFDDLSDRLLRTLAGKAETAAADELPVDTILVARAMGPAELLDYDRDRLKGVVVEEGGPNSHVAIVAKTLGLPAIGNARGVVDAVEAGDAAILDAAKGEVHVRPGPDVIEAFSDKARFRARKLLRYEALRGRPALTLDGQRVALNINAGLLVDLPHLVESGADGIGLFRTELEFMVSVTFPGRDRQTAIYQQILDAAGDAPVTFRTLDIGGDKMLPYLRHASEENPALGWRAVRMMLDRPGLFRTQVRALLRASAGRRLRMMIPMLTDVDELRQVRALIARELALLKNFGVAAPSHLEVGAMVEVPALLFQLDELCKEADFLSVGSNDLVQFLCAADRSNERVAMRYDPLSPPVLRALKSILTAADAAGRGVTLCGEVAGRPLDAMVLVGLGFRSISMAPASLGPVKAMVMSLDAHEFATYLEGVLQDGVRPPREAAQEFAQTNDVELS